jgi:2-polyprenyl-3-methyl-5-hydroxy-6-metoxy-1,4-benzoquinol methylase
LRRLSIPSVSNALNERLPPPLGCWCGHGELRTQFRTKKFGLVRCSACGCYRIDPPPVGGDEESAAFYTDYYGKGQFAEQEAVHEEPLRATRDSRFWRVVERYPDLGQPKEAVADIGCGEGGLCAELKAAGWHSVIGFDLSGTRVARARKRHPGIRFEDRAFPGGDLPAGSLDLVVLDNVVEHLTDPPETLRTVARYLKPSGRVALITPNMLSGQFRLLGRRWTPELSPHSHIFLFTEQPLKKLLTEAGFAVEAMGSYQLPPASLRSIAGELWRGKIKEALWHAMQEAGATYARWIKAGPMLYAVGRRI